MRHAPRLTLQVVTTAVLAVAGLAFAPGRAVAGCGDYVTVAGVSPHATPAVGRDSPPAPPGPCHGPNCSNRPADPLPPPTAPAADPNDPAAQPDAVELPLTACGRNAPTSSTVTSVRLSNLIFHPPRAA